ncbi:hypothetical protein SAMN05446635_0957 [Burkholderia sp. OK233]|nr:hypothetical protein SAMN05446635_0957 [Burkholderia sp. OK233]
MQLNPPASMQAGSKKQMQKNGAPRKGRAVFLVQQAA